MEMYADEESRGGVLEPQGTVEIKFRKREIIKLIERTDPEYASIKSKLSEYMIDCCRFNVTFLQHVLL